MLYESALLEPDELQALPDGESYELVDGHPVEKHMGAESEYIGATLLTLLNNAVRPQQMGYVFGSQTAYRCFPNRSRLVRKPDVSFVARGRFQNEVIPKGDILLAPDLAVEVVSPNDTYEEVEGKVNEYLGAGVRFGLGHQPDVQDDRGPPPRQDRDCSRNYRHAQRRKRGTRASRARSPELFI